MNITILIKSIFDRSDCLKRLLDSINLYYPDVPIMVAYDTSIPSGIEDFNIKIHRLPSNCGLSMGRNFLIDKTETENFFLIDDDFYLTNNESISQLLTIMNLTDATIVSGGFDGRMNNYYGFLSINNNHLTKFLYNEPPNELIYSNYEGIEYCKCNIVPNFFIGKTNTFKKRKILWDENLKIAEHDDFFIRFPPDLSIYHVTNKMGVHSHSKSTRFSNHDTWQRCRDISKVKHKLIGIETVSNITFNWKEENFPRIQNSKSGIKMI